MNTFTLPHCTAFAYCNHFRGPISQLIPESSKAFENPYLSILNIQAQESSHPALKAKEIHLGFVNVSIKHSLGLCEALDQANKHVLLTECTLAAPVLCKSQHNVPSQWLYYHTQYQMHSVCNAADTASNHLSFQDRAELNEDLFLRELGYACIALNKLKAAEALLAERNDPLHFKQLKELLSYHKNAISTPTLTPHIIDAQINDKHCWESLCLVLAEGQLDIAEQILEHFCMSPLGIRLKSHRPSIQHLKACLKAAYNANLSTSTAESSAEDNLDSHLFQQGNFPCEGCFKALQQLGHSGLAKELRILNAQLETPQA